MYWWKVRTSVIFSWTRWLARWEYITPCEDDTNPSQMILSRSWFSIIQLSYCRGLSKVLAQGHNTAVEPTTHIRARAKSYALTWNCFFIENIPSTWIQIWWSSSPARCPRRDPAPPLHPRSAAAGRETARPPGDFGSTCDSRMLPTQRNIYSYLVTSGRIIYTLRVTALSSI